MTLARITRARAIAGGRALAGALAAAAVVATAAAAPTGALAAGAPAIAALLLAFRSCRRGAATARRAVVLSSCVLTFWAAACAIRGVCAFWAAAGNG